MSRWGLRRIAGPAVALASALLLVPAPASAQPSIWDQAKQPRLAKAEHVLRAVERMFFRAQEAAFDPDMQADFTRSALAMLELAGGSALPDVRLRFLIGELLVNPAIGRYGEAESLIRRALKEAPRHPLAGQAWFNLAIAEAKLHHPKLEIDAYNHALLPSWRPELRANIYMNRGESRMVLGQLEPALADYRRAIQLAPQPELSALAYYGLGITLERSGDLPSALDAMHKANDIRVPPYGSALDMSSVFFVPPYDLFYYKALSAMADARDADKPAKKIAGLERAIQLLDPLPRRGRARRPALGPARHAAPGVVPEQARARQGRPGQAARAAPRAFALTYAARGSSGSAGARRMRLTLSASCTDSNTGRRPGPASGSPNAPLAARARARGPSSTRNTSLSPGPDGASITSTMRLRSRCSSSSPRWIRTRLFVMR